MDHQNYFMHPGPDRMKFLGPGHRELIKRSTTVMGGFKLLAPKLLTKRDPPATFRKRDITPFLSGEIHYPLRTPSSGTYPFPPRIIMEISVEHGCSSCTSGVTICVSHSSRRLVQGLTTVSYYQTSQSKIRSLFFSLLSMSPFTTTVPLHSTPYISLSP